MSSEITVVGLSARCDNLILKPLKKGDYKAFLDFSIAFDGYEIPLNEYIELWGSKEFAFLQTGKLALYLFKKQTANKFEVGEIFGYAEITPSQKEQHIAEVGYFVKKSERGKGYGKKILQMAIEVCKNMDFEILFASVKQTNAPSIAVLKSQNFILRAEDNNEFSATLKIQGKK